MKHVLQARQCSGETEGQQDVSLEMTDYRPPPPVITPIKSRTPRSSKRRTSASSIRRSFNGCSARRKLCNVRKTRKGSSSSVRRLKFEESSPPSSENGLLDRSNPRCMRHDHQTPPPKNTQDTQATLPTGADAPRRRRSQSATPPKKPKKKDDQPSKEL